LGKGKIQGSKAGVKLEKTIARPAGSLVFSETRFREAQKKNSREKAAKNSPSQTCEKKGEAGNQGKQGAHRGRVRVFREGKNELSTDEEIFGRGKVP